MIDDINDEARDLARHVLKFFDPHELEDAFTHHLRAVVSQERAEVERLRRALEDIALLDFADGHELTWEHASKAVAIATRALGKHPSEISRERT